MEYKYIRVIEYFTLEKIKEKYTENLRILSFSSNKRNECLNTVTELYDRNMIESVSSVVLNFIGFKET